MKTRAKMSMMTDLKEIQEEIARRDLPIEVAINYSDGFDCQMMTLKVNYKGKNIEIDARLRSLSTKRTVDYVVEVILNDIEWAKHYEKHPI